MPPTKNIIKNSGQIYIHEIGNKKESVLYFDENNQTYLDKGYIKFDGERKMYYTKTLKGLPLL